MALLAAAEGAQAQKRVALVIGNSAYRNVPVLPNPINDAGDIAASLQRLDFKVTRASNATFDDMRRALLAFGREARGSEIALIFFAGHGMEIGGENWLIPIDAELRNDTDAENEAVNMRTAMLQVANASRIGLVVLDACRNNPFAAKMQRSLRTRTVARGLAPTEPTDNVIVAYAARDGTTASDGTGRNSPFTSALLRHIETPDLEIRYLFAKVRDDVMAVTKREQQPFVYGSLSSDHFYFKQGAGAPDAAAPATQSPDVALWNAIRSSTLPAWFEEFIKVYPNSAHVAEARARLEELKKSQVAAVVPPVQPAVPPPAAKPVALPPVQPAPQSAVAPSSGSTGYPVRPIKIIVPFAAGGSTDLAARVVADRLTAVLGKLVIIENVAGAAGAIGSDRAAKAASDGYTLLAGNISTHGTAAALSRSLPYNPVTDFEPVGLLVDAPAVVIARKDFPAKNLNELAAYVKANSARITMAHAGVGSFSFSSCALLNSIIGGAPTTIPYSGSAPALNDVTGGHVDYMCEQVSMVAAMVKAGGFKVLGVASAERNSALPDVMSARESGLPEFQATSWTALFAPKGTPQAVIGKLSDALDRALDGETSRKLAMFGNDVPGQGRRGPAALGAFVRSETARWALVMKAAGVAP